HRRAEHPPCRARGARCGRRSERGRPRRGDHDREAVRIGRRREARERDTGTQREGEIGMTDESLSRAEELLARLENARAELDRLSTDENASPERALEILSELSELAKAVEEELERAKREAESDAAQS